MRVKTNQQMSLTASVIDWLFSASVARVWRYINLIITIITIKSTALIFQFMMQN